MVVFEQRGCPVPLFTILYTRRRPIRRRKRTKTQTHRRGPRALFLPEIHCGKRSRVTRALQQQLSRRALYNSLAFARQNQIKQRERKKKKDDETTGRGSSEKQDEFLHMY